MWNLACYAGPLFDAYAPIAGGFWNSTQPECPTGPVNLRHIHGAADRVVALDEVGIYNSMPIPEGLETLRRLKGCGPEPAAEWTAGTERRPLSCRSWRDCANGGVLVLCLHERGHSIPAEWVAEGFDWMTGLPE